MSEQLVLTREPRPEVLVPEPCWTDLNELFVTRLQATQNKSSVDRQLRSLDSHVVELNESFQQFLSSLKQELGQLETMVAKQKILAALRRFANIQVDKDAVEFLAGHQAYLKSALNTARAVDGYFQLANSVERVVVSLSNDTELESTSIVLLLFRRFSTFSDLLEEWRRILSFLEPRLSDDDKLRVLVRVKRNE